MFHGEVIPAGWLTQNDIIVPITRDAYVEVGTQLKYKAGLLSETMHDGATAKFNSLNEACIWAMQLNNVNLRLDGVGKYSIMGKGRMTYVVDRHTANLVAARIIIHEDTIYASGYDNHMPPNDIMYKLVGDIWVRIGTDGSKISETADLCITSCRPYVIQHIQNGDKIVATARCLFRITINTADDTWSTDRGAGVFRRAN